MPNLPASTLRVTSTTRLIIIINYRCCLDNDTRKRSTKITLFQTTNSQFAVGEALKMISPILGLVLDFFVKPVFH